MSQVPSHLHYQFDFVEDFSSLPCTYGVAHGHLLRAPSHINEWRTTFGVIFRFDPNAASSWQRTRTSKGARSSWSWTPSSLVLSYFAKLPHPGDLVTSQPCFRWWTQNCLWRLLWNQRHFYLRWSSVPDVGHYRWLCSPIRQLPPNRKADYLVRTIRCILDFLQLWTMA